MHINNSLKKVFTYLQQEKVALIVMLLLVLFVAKNQSEKWHNWSDETKTYRQIVRSDGSGYFAYLPQVFIYQHKHFQFIEHAMDTYPDHKMHEFMARNAKNEIINKYFVGVAVCQAPFFIATRLTHSSEYKMDGYSLPYQKSVAIGAIVFLLLGLWLSFMVLLYFKISPWIAAISLSAFAIGTPMMYYTVNDPLTAHVYSFTLITLFYYSLLRWQRSYSMKWLLFIVFSYGMVIILRPSNGIVFLLYFSIFPTIKTAWNFLLNNLIKQPKRLIPSILLFGVIISLQIVNVYNQTGHLGFNIYGDETFSNWNNPPIWEVLFSFRKGLFIYAPLCLISLIGFYFLWKKHPSNNRFIFFFLLVFTYVTASWWCWWYGGSLGMRPFIDVTLFFIIALAFFLQYAKTIWKIALLPLIAFCIYYQFILTIQMDTSILHYADMNKERFKHVFLKTDRRFQWNFFVDPPKKLAPSKKIHHYFSNGSQMVYNPNLKDHLRPHDYVTEHMNLTTFFQHAMDSTFKGKKGVRFYSDIKISDHNNIPWINYEIFKDNKWQGAYTDFVGMRISNINQSTAIESDWVFSEKELKADSIRFQWHNTHGKTTLSNWKFDIFE